MVDLTGSRLRMLEAFQRNGYSCSYSKNYGFAVSGENGYSICCHSFKEYKHYFSVNIKVIRNIDTYYNEEKVLQSSIDLSYSTFEEDFKVKVLNWLVKGGFLLKTPNIVLNKSKEELTEFFI